MTVSKNRIRNGEATRKKILKQAEKLFARKGYNGVSIRELAGACKMSGPLILHHFGSKQGIYDAVRLNLIKEYIPFFKNLEHEEKDFPVFFEDILREMFSFHRKNPVVLRLMNWDRLEGNKQSWPKAEEFKRIFTERIRKAVAAGEIDGGFSPRYFSLMLGGMVHLWWEEHDLLLQETLGGKCTAEDALKIDEQYIQQILLFLRKSLKKSQAPL
ncbi:MAG: TetR/AcrR family transcriptional regulator [Victivallales bacterium]|nr:TetR/AcrR family transcriptional regulator [Victivallales bacterium]